MEGVPLLGPGDLGENKNLSPKLTGERSAKLSSSCYHTGGNPTPVIRRQHPKSAAAGGESAAGACHQLEVPYALWGKNRSKQDQTNKQQGASCAGPLTICVCLGMCVFVCTNTTKLVLISKLHISGGYYKASQATWRRADTSIILMLDGGLKEEHKRSQDPQLSKVTSW